MACFHIPSVTCENCAHLQKGSAKGPWVETVLTGSTYFHQRSGDLRVDAGNGLRMGDGTPLSVIGDIDRQSDALVARALTERDEARAERDALHLALRQVLDALGNGSGATEEASVEFLCRAPEEVRAVVTDLRGEMIAARAEEKAAVEAADEARAALEFATIVRDHAEERAREYLLDGGAAEMRERAACAVEEADDGVPLQNLADHIRTLPMPEEVESQLAQSRIEAAAEMRERAAVAVEYALTSGLLTPFTARRVIGAVRALPLPGDEQ